MSDWTDSLSRHDRQQARRRMWAVVGVGVAVILILLMAGLMVFIGADATERTLIPIVFSVVIVMMVIASTLALSSRQQTGEKAKRAGVDMYSLIDRMVDDLDEDEADYLRRRLDDRERGLEETLQETLDRREDDRLAGRR